MPTVADEMSESYGIKSGRIGKHEVYLWLAIPASIPQCLQLDFQPVGIKVFVVDISGVFPLAMLSAIDKLAGNEFINPFKPEIRNSSSVFICSR